MKWFNASYLIVWINLSTSGVQIRRADRRQLRLDSFFYDVLHRLPTDPADAEIAKFTENPGVAEPDFTSELQDQLTQHGTLT